MSLSSLAIGINYYSYVDCLDRSINLISTKFTISVLKWHVLAILKLYRLSKYVQ